MLKKVSVQRFWAKNFGDKSFIKTYWTLLLPSLAWGLITSLVPMLFNLFVGLVFTLKDGSHGSIYVAENYTYSTLVVLNYIATIFTFSFFAAIGNFAGKKDFEGFKQTLRASFYTSMFISFILMLFEEIFATQFAQHLVFLGSYNDKEIEITVLLIRPMAFIGFFFSWMWIYVPALPSIKNNKPLYYSALVGFIFFIICDPIFIYSFQSSFELNINNPQALLDLQLKAATGTGIIYLVYFIIQPFYVYFYLKFYKYLRKMTLVVLQPFMKWFYLKKPDQYQTYLDNLKNVFNQNYLESQVLFFNKFRVSLYYWRIILLLSWGNLLDQSFYNLIAVLHFVYSTNFGGQFPNGPGFEHISVLEGWNQTVSNFAANHYFKLIMANPEMLLIFFFGIWDSFSVLPSYFVARELGIGNKKQAKTNMWRCMHWSYLMGASFTIIIIIFALFINQYATYPAQSGMFNYDIDYNGHVVATVKYYQLWDDARNAMIIWAFMLFFFTATDMGFYVILSGASKILIVGDALITAIFVGVAMALYYTHFNNMLGFYFIPHLDKIVKYFIYITFIFTSQSSNSINDVMKVKNEVKQPVEELEPSPMSPN